jgi:hypothetical protein
MQGGAMKTARSTVGAFIVSLALFGTIYLAANLLSSNTSLQIANCRQGNVGASLDRWVREHVLGYNAPSSILTRHLRPIRNCAATVAEGKTVVLREGLQERSVRSVICEQRLPIYNPDGTYSGTVALPGEPPPGSTKPMPTPEGCDKPIPRADEVPPLKP